MNEELPLESSAAISLPAAARRVSWGAIFAGIIVTIVIQLMLTLLGTAIGASTINPQQEQNPAQGLALVSAIWLLVTGLVSIWVGACVAGRLSGGPRRADGMLHGIVTWSASTLVMLLMVASAMGALLGGTGALLGSLVSSSQGAGSQNATASAEEALRQTFPKAGNLLPPTGRNEAQQTPGTLTGLAQKDPELMAALTRMAAQGGAEKAPQARDQVLSLLTSKHGMDQQQAAQMIDQWNQQYQQVQSQASQKAKQVGQAAAHGISQGALWAFIALLLGLLVAAWGGWAGAASVPRVVGTTVVH